MDGGDAPWGLVEEHVALGDGHPALTVLRPASSDSLIDERRFADEDEYLPYWAELWPSAVTLGRWLTEQAGLDGRRVLEVGCGLGVPALAAARAGADVVATDWSAEAVGAVLRNAALNGVQVRAQVADWRDADALAALGPFDVLLAADVLYEERNVEPLLALLEALAVPRVVLADPSRTTAEPFLDAAASGHAITTTADPDRSAVRLHELRRL